MTWKDKTTFKDRIREWAKKIEVPLQSITIRPMKNKWASCSTNGNLTFDSSLLNMDQEISDYVIVHELLHFRVPNHGKLWKSYMWAYLGDFEKTEEKLKTNEKNKRQIP
ncbi:M48 family metallopeptidase [candidate division KSB1 bacterium]|nr:M48 family metallopeptidase [candidate division KSB1 bacterium]